jgi:hypothetical protein
MGLKDDTLVVHRAMPNGDVRAILRRAAPYRVLSVANGPSYIVGQQPFDDPPILVPALDGTGFALVDRMAAKTVAGATFRVTRIGARGDTLFDRTVTYTPVPVSGALVSQAIEFLAGPAAGPSGTAIRTAIRKQLYVPKYLPPVTQAVIALDGSIWLRREEMSPGKSGRWTVLPGIRGAPYEVTLDENMLPYEIDGTRVWGTIRQEDGTNKVVKVLLEAKRKPAD